jgi:predicted ATPase
MDPASQLAPSLRPSFRRRLPDAYFLRAEFQAHFASLLDARNADPDFRMWGDPYELYGGRSLHTRSHGEAFLAILQNRIRSGLLLETASRARGRSGTDDRYPDTQVQDPKNAPIERV